MGEQKTSKQAEEELNIMDFAAAEDELANLRASAGIQEEPQKHGPLWRLIDWALTYRETREKQPVNRKTYLRLCLLGIFGAHRFYAKQWFTAVVYLLTCWTGISFVMTLIDAMIALPMKADENGIIYL